MARRGANEPNALIAAARRLPLKDGVKLQAEKAKPQDWHNEAWTYFDDVPEVGESLTYRANQIAKVRLFVAVDNPTDPDGDPVPALDEASGVPQGVAQEANAELARMRSEQGGQGEILRMYDLNMSVVGECYLVGYAERPLPPAPGAPPPPPGAPVPEAEPENWEIRSITEVEVKGTGKSATVIIKNGENDRKGRTLDAEHDTAIRLWLRHPRWAQQATAPMRHLLGDCRTLQVLCQQLLAHAYRALSAGLLTIPNELTFGTATPATPDTPAEADADPLTASLDEVLSGPVEDPTSPSTVQPGVLRGPAEFLRPEYVRRITFYDADMVRDLEARMEARITRIARGLNLPVEKVMGHQQTTYANASQIDEDEFSDYLEPSTTIAVQALTHAFLQPQLRAAGGEAAAWADRLFIWFDPSDLIAQPDTEKNANEAHSHNTISDAAHRKALGFSEDDAPTPLELLQRAGLRRGILTADLTLALLKLLGVEIDVALPAASAGVAPQNVQGGEANAALAQLMAQLTSGLGAGASVRQMPRPALRAASRPAANHGRQLVDIDRELRARVLAAANAAMGAALDRAANRLAVRAAGKPARAALNSVPRRHRFVQLGPSMVAEAMDGTDPLEGAWDELGAQYMLWGADAQDQALGVAADAAGTTPDASVTDQQRADLDGSWVWMAGALTVLANDRLWNPDPAAPAQGEFDPNLTVPPGLVRQAMARAGGATGLSTDGGGDLWLTLTDANTRPAGGIATGELIRGVLRDGGAGVEGYRWVYGPAFRQRPFEPHAQLDGVVFDNFDSAVLANTSGWPDLPFYMPGDHSGCICDFEPIIIPAGG